MEPIIFRFNCAFCGSRPRPQPFPEYLKTWEESPQRDFEGMLDHYLRILLTIRNGQGMRQTKKLRTAIDRLAAWFDIESPLEPTNRLVDGEVAAISACPICRAEAGKRPKDRYFTAWSLACAVQVANFFYEAGIIIFSVLQKLPRWASPERLGEFGDLLFLNQKVLSAISLLECPFCGRKTTCLYGDGTAENPHRCRWCLDASGGGAFVLLSLGIEKDGSVVLRATKPPLPNKVDSTIVPWQIAARIKRRQRR
jgi:hypothetical protein